jgi:signal transduction histidine kinase/chemotaxis protein histidine kinase CheA
VLLGRLRVRGKLTLLVLLPLAAVLLTVIPLTGARLGAVGKANRTADTVSRAVTVGTLIQQLQQERLVLLGYQAGQEETGDLVVRAAAVRDAAAAVRDGTGSAQLIAAAGTVGDLENVRHLVLRTPTAVDPGTVYSAYGTVIESLIDGLGLNTDADTSTRLGREELALDALIRHDEAISAAGAAMLVGLARPGGKVDADVVSLVAAAVGAQGEQERLFLDLAAPSAIGLYREVQEGPASQTVQQLLSRVTGDPAGAIGDDVAASLLPSVESLTGLGRLVQIKVGRDVAAESASVARTAAIVGAIVIIGALLLFGLVVLLSVLMARAIANPLRRLTDSAEAVATVASAELVRVADEEDLEVAVPHLVPVAVDTNDELGDLARAFNRVQEVAGSLVERQLISRRNVATMFGNVGRRTQNLVGRQLAMIDGLERSEQDPIVLERLYRLDHVSTRLRRNANSLVVLSGAAEQSIVAEPLSIGDAIRSALGEIEGFLRVRLREADDVELAPQVATDTILLLAELLENSTSFSPPHTEVDVTAHAVAGGCRVTIVDHGIGMTDAQLADENARLVQRERLDLAPTDVLGLFVVGRLARRHQIEVTLRPTAGTGVTAEVFIPARLLIGGQPARPEWATTAAPGWSAGEAAAGGSEPDPFSMLASLPADYATPAPTEPGSYLPGDPYDGPTGAQAYAQPPVAQPPVAQPPVAEPPGGQPLLEPGAYPAGGYPEPYGVGGYGEPGGGYGEPLPASGYGDGVEPVEVRYEPVLDRSETFPGGDEGEPAAPVAGPAARPADFDLRPAALAGRTDITGQPEAGDEQPLTQDAAFREAALRETAAREAAREALARDAAAEEAAARQAAAEQAAVRQADAEEAAVQQAAAEQAAVQQAAAEQAAVQQAAAEQAAVRQADAEEAAVQQAAAEQAAVWQAAAEQAAVRQADAQQAAAEQAAAQQVAAQKTAAQQAAARRAAAQEAAATEAAANEGAAQAAAREAAREAAAWHSGAGEAVAREYPRRRPVPPVEPETLRGRPTGPGQRSPFRPLDDAAVPIEDVVYLPDSERTTPGMRRPVPRDPAVDQPSVGGRVIRAPEPAADPAVDQQSVGGRVVWDPAVDQQSVGGRVFRDPAADPAGEQPAVFRAEPPAAEPVAAEPVADAAGRPPLAPTEIDVPTAAEAAGLRRRGRSVPTDEPTGVARRVPGAQLPDTGPPAQVAWGARETPEAARRAVEEFEAGVGRAEQVAAASAPVGRPVDRPVSPAEDPDSSLLDRWERLHRRVPGIDSQATQTPDRRRAAPPPAEAAEPALPAEPAVPAVPAEPARPRTPREMVDEFEAGVQAALDKLAAVTAKHADTLGEPPFASAGGDAAPAVSTSDTEPPGADAEAAAEQPGREPIGDDGVPPPAGEARAVGAGEDVPLSLDRRGPAASVDPAEPAPGAAAEPELRLNRRVPGAQLPSTLSRRDTHGDTVAGATLDPEAARALVEEFEAGVARAMGSGTDGATTTEGDGR